MIPRYASNGSFVMASKMELKKKIGDVLYMENFPAVWANPQISLENLF